MKPGFLNLLTKLSATKVQPKHQEFLDEHFSVSPKWDTLKKKLRSPAFVEAIKQDIRSDEKLKRYSEANSKHIRTRGVPTFQIQSQSGNKPYTVKYHPDIDRFSCNCGDWSYTRSHQTGRSQQDCKHIKSVKASNPDISALTKQAAFGCAAINIAKEKRLSVMHPRRVLL